MPFSYLAYYTSVRMLTDVGMPVAILVGEIPVGGDYLGGTFRGDPLWGITFGEIPVVDPFGRSLWGDPLWG